MKELNYDNIEYLRNFIPFKAFFDSLLPRYDEYFDTIGGILKREAAVFYVKITDEDEEELIDFLDGNGFEVGRENLTRFFNYIAVKPQYPPKPEPTSILEPYTSISITISSPPTDEEIEEMRLEAGEFVSIDEKILKCAKEIKELSDMIARWLTEKGRAPPKEG
jgi:hypothetical protein